MPWPRGHTRHFEPGRADKSVPTFEGDLMMFAKSREEIREWIRDGSTAAKRRSETWRRDRERGALRMPAFEKHLMPGDVDACGPTVLWLREMAAAGAGRPR